MSSFSKQSRDNFRCLEGQNDFIVENDQLITTQKKLIADYAEKIDKIQQQFPDLSSYDALKEAISQLRQSKLELEKKIEELHYQVMTIEEHQKLKEELADLQRELSTYDDLEEFDREDIYLCFYSPVGLSQVLVGAFEIQSSEDEYIHLKSIDGAKDMLTDCSISKNNRNVDKMSGFNCEDEEVNIDAYLLKGFTFTEVCIQLGIFDLPCKEVLTSKEIYDVLAQFQKHFENTILELNNQPQEQRKR